MNALDKLNQELAERMAARKVELAETIAIAKVNMQLAKIESPLYMKRELLKEDEVKLQVISNTIQEAYDRDDRKMSLVFGYGILPNKILAIMKSIQFSKKEEREELLMLTGLDESIIEQTLDAFGSTAYFSKNTMEVVPAIPMDVPLVKELLLVVATDLGLVSTLDLGKFNSANMNYQYDRAAIRAEELYNNTKDYVETAITYAE